MVLNCVLHRLNIDHVDQIIDMALQMGAEYLELANTQYYGWAQTNREQLLPTARATAARGSGRRTAIGGESATRCRLYFVVPDYFETPAQALHERLGLGVPRHRARWRRAACHAARCCRA